MNKTELSKLFAFRDKTDCEVQKTDPKLWSTFITDRGNRLKARILNELQTSTPKILEHIASTDFTQIDPRDVVDFLRKSLHQAGFDPKEIQEQVISKLTKVHTEEKPQVDNCHPLMSDPEMVYQLEKARLYEIAGISKMDDGLIEKIGDQIADAGGVDDTVLHKLVDQGSITEDKAKELGLTATLYALADENVALASAMRHVRPEYIQGKPISSAKDLAVLKASDWEKVLSENNEPLPKGITREQTAKVLANRFAALNPDKAFLGRLSKANQGAIESGVKSLEPLFAKNTKVIAADFKDLNIEGISLGQIKEMEMVHTRLQSLVRTYPKFQLDEVIDNQQTNPADKAAIVSHRISLIERMEDKLVDEELFTMDFAPNSPDLEKLDFASIGASEEEKKMMIGTLKTYQRNYQLTQNVDDSIALMQRGFYSSLDIATRSFAEFQQSVNFNDRQAQIYWNNARKSFSDSNLTLSSILDNNYGLFRHLAVNNFGTDINDYLRQLDGYEALFGNLSFCSCSHCQSVLGPAAYFVDLMKFVDEHIRPQFRTRNNHPLDLKTRRPDLWTLDLTCACKDERIPTLDVVNEVLENYTAQLRRYSGSLTDRAAVSNFVYGRTLLDAVNSFKQPFHLPLARIDSYLRKLETSRAAIALLLTQNTVVNAKAILELSSQQWRYITRQESDLGVLSTIYGITFARAGSTVTAVDVQQLLPRTGVSREDLGKLITTSFITTGGASVSIRAERRNSDSIQNDIEKIHGLTVDVLDRMHRFTRLWKKVPWTIEELDRVLNALSNNSLGEQALIAISQVRDIQNRLAITSDETCAMFSLIPRTPSGASLFDRLFNPPTIVVTDGAFPKDTTHFIHPAFRNTPASIADPALPRLLAGLQIELDDLGRLIRHLSQSLSQSASPDVRPRFNPDTGNEEDRYFVLSASNLALLYRHARLTQLLHISVDETFQLVAFAGLNGAIRSLDDLGQFLNFHGWWKQSGYRLDDIAVATGVLPGDATKYPSAEALTSGIVAGAKDILVFDQTLFAAALGVTEQTSRELISRNATILVAVNNGKWRLADGIDLASVIINIPDGATVPVQPSGNRPLEANDVRTVLQPYRPSELLLVRLAAALRLEPAKTRALTLLAVRNLGASELAAAMRNEGPVTSIQGLITALIPYTVAFRSSLWDVDAITMVQQRRELFSLPTTGPTVDTLRCLSAYVRLASRTVGTAANAPQVSPTDVRAVFEAYDLNEHSFRSAIDTPLARILGLSSGIVLGLRNHITASRPGALAIVQLSEAALMAQKIGIDGETLTAIISDDYPALDGAANALFSAYGSKFSNETERKKQLSSIEEPLREQKRDALVPYLVYSIPQRFFNSPEELYAYFLIDVQAGGCATTSCIVAAISSVQLYVHRVMMNLEQDRRDPADPRHIQLQMPKEAAEEWTWRKNYRVWEANRKVFLWPENYVEPDLRDDKTPLFKELESELLQTDITDQNVLDAYTKYLKGFEEVASLTIAGAYHDVRNEGGQTIDVLHLFGVATNDPPVYYYRTCESLIASGRNSRQFPVWSPWRKIEVQITGRKVSPVVYLNRLHIFWAEYRTRPINQLRDGSSIFGGYQHTLSIKFSSLRPDGQWSVAQAVELPSRGINFGKLGPGPGIIQDQLNGFSDGERPLLDVNMKIHNQPIDGYTLQGAMWDWLWLEPVVINNEPSLSICYRNFIEGGQLDLFAMRLNPVFPNSLGNIPPLLFYKHNESLYFGSRGWMTLYNKPALANAIIDENRLNVLKQELWGLWNPLISGLNTEDINKIAALRTNTTLLAIPGSEEDAIVQKEHDVILLQGSATDNNIHIVHRIGTTLSEEISRRLFTSGFDKLLQLNTQEGLHEADLPFIPVNGRIQDQTNARKLDFNGAYGVYYRELFFHIPFLIANALNSRGRFASAQRWYHYVFNPTATADLEGISPEEQARQLLDRVWRYLAFRNLGVPRLREILTDGAALAVYHKNPFNPHAIARLRPSAYQKAIVMKYIDNLLDWADNLFTQFTTESVNEALMLYVMAEDILGQRPARLGDCGEGVIHPKTYQNIAPTLGQGEEILNELETWTIGKRVSTRRKISSSSKRRPYSLPKSAIEHIRNRNAFESQTQSVLEEGISGPVKQAEAINQNTPVHSDADGNGMFRGYGWNETYIDSWGPNLGSAAVANKSYGASGRVNANDKQDPVLNIKGIGTINKADLFSWSITRQAGPVFCIPVNQDLLAYWDRVEDRLYKIRHCMDINGQKRELALFAPEIDPRLLVRMRAAGLTLEDVLGTTSGSLPPYRFLYLIDRAKGFASTLSSFGAALLSAMEKKDAEEMGRLRLVHQQNLSRMTTQLRRWDIETAEDALAVLQRQREAAEYRRDFYGQLITSGRTQNEQAQSTARHIASGMYGFEATVQTMRGIGALIPQVGSPFSMNWGGIQLKGSSAGFAAVTKATAQMGEAVAASTGLEAGFDRRTEGWKHQKELADRDVVMLNKQIEAANIRVKIAERSLELHEKSIEQLDEMLELTDGKFTNLGRYTWLSAKLSQLYRNAFQNAMALARLAEQAFRFERGDETLPGLSPSPWDSTTAGLLSGEQLLMDLQNLERRFLETNYRSHEVDQTFALSQISPEALIELREDGKCRFTVPELFFDLYYPGHYKRRIKAVRLTIPSITGPYVNVSATLTLESSFIRPTAAEGQALVVVPPRRTVSVATSTAQNDAGVFELSFRDERYMPFENAGAVNSTWYLQLPKNFRQFDYQTITEVILSISYTAEFDGALRGKVEENNARVERSILHYLSMPGNSLGKLFSLRQDFSSTFTRLLRAGLNTGLSINIDDRNFPIFLQRRSLQVNRGLILLRTKDAIVPSNFRLTIDRELVQNFSTRGNPGGLPGQELPPVFRNNLKGSHTIAIASAGDIAPNTPTPGDPYIVDPEKLLDIILYIEFQLSASPV